MSSSLHNKTTFIVVELDLNISNVEIITLGLMVPVPIMFVISQPMRSYCVLTKIFTLTIFL